jgi:hypothetical protein
MLELGLRLAVGGVLLISAARKAVAPRATTEALATFGLGGGPVAWAALVGGEAALGGLVIAGSDLASIVGAGVMLAFAGELLVVLARGGRGAPCACFGPRSRVSGWAVLRNVALACALAATPFVPAVDPAPDVWLAVGLGIALAACGGLAVAVLALAREVGALRLAVSPQAALELDHEGPELGSRADLVGRLPFGPGSRLGLAVFTSEGCRACQALEPAIDYLARDPLLAATRFDERLDADAWTALDVPGSPFAVALGPDGTVLAKGTFNTLGQLEGILAAAERRAGWAAHA